ncbi:MAG: DMT family transporter [Lachnospiraceae bacterium]|nr:DMT family transporter [Lachnospiraceae bacterium]
MERLKKPAFVFAIAVLCNFLWGSAVPMVKIGYGWFAIDAADTATQLLFAGVRFSLAGLLVIGLGSLMRRTVLVPKGTQLPQIGLVALFQTVGQYLFYYIGVAHTTGVKASIVIAMNTFLIILLSVFVFRMEKMTKKKLIGCILGFVGVVLINLSSKNSLDLQVSLLGEGFVFFAQISYAFSCVVMKKFSSKQDPMLLSGYQFFFGGLVLALIGLITGGSLIVWNVKNILLLTYLAMVSGVAFSLWSLLLKHNPVSKVVIYGFLAPLFGVIMSAIVLGEGSEAFSLRGLVALILVCSGVLVVNTGGSHD